MRKREKVIQKKRREGEKESKGGSDTGEWEVGREREG